MLNAYYIYYYVRMLSVVRMYVHTYKCVITYCLATACIIIYVSCISTEDTYFFHFIYGYEYYTLTLNIIDGVVIF